ncbi:Alpha/Beta hydrolase protein [Boletus edulis BED1]|uniref:Carboxylic ester hydrolase n=1 Tax=Boletus edulis BED1 TaxID=1328754 RepID=A0AAD4GK16_BOLED|nr:Alpha/Beta hydrolase protein [Boletus edulis BED1]
MSLPHIPQELQPGVRVVVETKYGPITGGRTSNGAAVFLEVPYALPPVRFTDPQSLPEGYRYEDRDYVYETKHCYQPANDGQGAGVLAVDRKGHGEPSEDPLFVNIVSPSSFTHESKFPVKVYIHGGFLQFGSPHGLSSQAQYVAQERSEVWVNIGYRLSVFGFLACDEPKIDGNFGFKDQWLALQWIQEHIEGFGGDPANVQLTGLSAGAHSVHQILHHISHLPEGQESPIKSANLQSNAMLTIPKTAAKLRPQYEALCRGLNLDPASPTTLTTLRDPSLVPATRLLHIIETDEVGVDNGTYRGCLDGTWIPTSPDPMTWQRTGDLARRLRAKGVTHIAIGDLSEEWYLYAIAHPVYGPRDVFSNVLRYYPRPIVERLVERYRTLEEGASVEEATKLMGEILSDGQVHLPVRMFVRDFYKADFPVLRYEIRWTPEQVRPQGLVTHATDRCFWALRVPSMTAPQKRVAIAWLDAIDNELAILERGEGKSTRPLNQALTLREDQTIAWQEDRRWDQLMDIAKVLPGEA